MVTADFRPMNVTLRPQSRALHAYAARAGIEREVIAAGFGRRPGLDMTYQGGRTITDLVFVNYYLGGAAAWDAGDRQNIDAALSAVMADEHLENVIRQYFRDPITSQMLPSEVVEGAVGERFFKDRAETLVGQLVDAAVPGRSDPASTVVCLMLPRGVVLVDGNSDGSDARHDEDDRTEAGHARHRPVLVDDEQADSLHGLGGYHGSVHVGGSTVYYAVGVYSEGENGIVAFDEPWKNVVATFYHELCEARTDPDVEDVIRGGAMSLLGWYSRRGGEIGDIPMSLAGADLSLVMKEIQLTGGGTAPMQLQWSNAVHGPEGPIDHPHSPVAQPTGAG